MILHTKYCVFLQVFLLACIGFGGEWNRDGSEGCFSQATPPEVQESPWRYEQQELLGWKLHIRRELIENQAEAAKLKLALEILQKQLEQIVRVVPGDCVAKLQRVELWFSPVYPEVENKIIIGILFIIYFDYSRVLVNLLTIWVLLKYYIRNLDSRGYE